MNEWVEHSSDTVATFGRLTEAIHKAYPTVVVGGLGSGAISPFYQGCLCVAGWHLHGQLQLREHLPAT